jgi:hypothetical protein
MQRYMRVELQRIQLAQSTVLLVDTENIAKTDTLSDDVQLYWHE